MSAELMKSKFVRRPSVRPSVCPSVRPSVCGIDYLLSYCMDCFQISVVASPGAYAQEKNFFFFDFLGIFFVFFKMGPYGSQNFKTLLLPQISFESFQTLSEISSQWSYKSSVLDFWNFEFLIFQEFCSFSLTWDPMGAKTSKRYSSLKSLLNPFKLFLNFLLSGPDKSTVLDFWNFEFLIVQEFCSFSLMYTGYFWHLSG